VPSAREHGHLIIVAWARSGLRALEIITLALVAVYVTYVVGATALVNSTLLRQVLNPDPGYSRISWDFAYSYWPRRLDVHNLGIVGQGIEIQWELQVPHARGEVSLLPLLGRRFIAEKVNAERVVVLVRPTVAPDPQQMEQARAFPRITGLEDPPLRYEGPVPPPDRRAWTVDLRDARFNDVREVWVGPYRAKLTGRARGDLQTRGGWNLYFDGEGVIDRARILLRGDTVIEHAAAHVHAAMDLVDLPGSLNHERLRSLRGVLQASARGVSLEALTHPIRPLRGRFSGVGVLDLAVGYAGGTLTAGSTIKLEGRDGGFQLQDGWRLSAPNWSVRGSAGRGGGAKLTGTLRPLRLTDRGKEVLESRQGTVKLETGQASLLPPYVRPAISVELERTRPAPVSRFSRWLSAAPVDFDSGWVTAEATSRITAQGVPSASLLVRIRDARGHFKNGLFAGQLLLELNLERLRIRTGGADLSGSRVALQDLTLITPEGRVDGWDASLSLPVASLRMESRRLIATVEGRASDARPVLLLSRRRARVKRLLRAEGLEVRARVDLSPDRLILPSFRLEGRGLRLWGGLLRDGEGTHGAMLARVRGVPLGLTFMGLDMATSFALRDVWLEERLEDTGVTQAVRAAQGRTERGVGGAGAAE